MIRAEHIVKSFDGRVVLDDITLTAEQLRNFTKICIVACGTAYHVGVVAKYAFEDAIVDHGDGEGVYAEVFLRRSKARRSLSRTSKS
mgnify:CR=1 FL=1